jgi:hypothetical protein
MPRAEKLHLHTRGHRKWFSKGHAPKLFEELANARGSVERFGSEIPAVSLPGREAGTFDFELGKVLEEELYQELGGAGDPNRASKALIGKAREEAGMVQVGVGQDDRRKRLRLKGKREAVARFQLGWALEDSAVDKELSSGKL